MVKMSHAGSAPHPRNFLPQPSEPQRGDELKGNGLNLQTSTQQVGGGFESALTCTVGRAKLPVCVALGLRPHPPSASASAHGCCLLPRRLIRLLLLLLPFVSETGNHQPAETCQGLLLLLHFTGATPQCCSTFFLFSSTVT